MIEIVTRFFGDDLVPQDVRRRRRQVYDVMRRFGQPVLVKHMYNDRDVKAGIAKPTTNFDDVYGQTRNHDPLSYGVGFESVERADGEWTNGREVRRQATSPGTGWVKAPKYRGFDKGYLTYVIQPDVNLDLFKISEAGTLIQIQDQTVQAPWFPDLFDNDLLVNVELDHNGQILGGRERYQLKQTNAITMRGLDRRGRREGKRPASDNRYTVSQTFNMSLVPPQNILYEVEIDR